MLAASWPCRAARSSGAGGVEMVCSHPTMWTTGRDLHIPDISTINRQNIWKHYNSIVSLNNSNHSVSCIAFWCDLGCGPFHSQFCLQVLSSSGPPQRHGENWEDITQNTFELEKLWRSFRCLSSLSFYGKLLVGLGVSSLLYGFLIQSCWFEFVWTLHCVGREVGN